MQLIDSQLSTVNFVSAIMAYFRNIGTLVMLLAILTMVFGQVAQGGPHVDQGGPHQNQGRVLRQIAQDQLELDQDQDDEDGDQPDQRAAIWTTCNFTETPRLSCQDCNTRLICKPIGGLLKACNNPFRPYCNNGICSSVPSPGCE